MSTLDEQQDQEAEAYIHVEVARLFQLLGYKVPITLETLKILFAGTYYLSDMTGEQDPKWKSDVLMRAIKSRQEKVDKLKNEIKP